jgi:hypothetical protein
MSLHHRLCTPALTQIAAYARSQQPPVDAGLLGEAHATGSQSPANASDHLHKGTPLLAQEQLQTPAQRRGHIRALARGRDGDQQWVAAHQRWGNEAALLGPVHDVDQHSQPLRLIPALLVDGQVVAGVDGDTGAGKVAGPEVTADQLQRARPRELAQSLARL